MNHDDRAAREFHAADCIDRGHPRRAEVEGFVRQVYRLRHGAELRTFYPHLLGFFDSGGGVAAALGLRCGIEGPLFVERYLDEPVAAMIERYRGIRPGAAEIVELGNFAALSPGAARALILSLIPVLRDAGWRWVLFVATRQLRNTFARLGLGAQALRPADPGRLGDEAASWGRYYDTSPQVCLGDLQHVRAARQEAHGSLQACVVAP